GGILSPAVQFNDQPCERARLGIVEAVGHGLQGLGGQAGLAYAQERLGTRGLAARPGWFAADALGLPADGAHLLRARRLLPLDPDPVLLCRLGGVEEGVLGDLDVRHGGNLPVAGLLRGIEVDPSALLDPRADRL